MDFGKNIISWPFRKKLLIFLLVISLPSFVIIAAEGFRQRQRAIMDAQNEALLLVRSLAAQQEQITITTKTLLSTLAQLPEVQNLDDDACRQRFRDLQRQYPFYTVITASTPDGRTFAASSPFDPAVNLADRRHFREAVRTQDFAAGEYQVGRISNKISFNYAFPERELLEQTLREEALKNSLEQTQKALRGTVKALASALEMRDPYTSGHQRRVTQLACAIGKELGFSKEEIEGMRMIGFLHDIGKIGVPAEILNKPGKINDHEFSIIKMHVEAGFNILKEIDFPCQVAESIAQHHERLDGSGYPKGLSGSEILLQARILAVADVMEAMSSHRPYRPGLGIEEALKEVTNKKGTHFDPEVVDACVRLFAEKGFAFD